MNKKSVFIVVQNGPKKNGKNKGVQNFRCYDCRRQFLGGTRINNNVLWHDYIAGKQTYKQLSENYKVSLKTIQRRLDKVEISKQFHKSKQSVILMDTTYFGRNFGVMLFKNTEGYHLYWKYVRYETVAEYLCGIEYIKKQGIEIKGVVCDGRRGLFKALSAYPVQMCQFHQAAIVTRYITKNPRTQASIELKELMYLLPRTDKESFFGGLDDWFKKWQNFLNERTTNPETGKSWYVHKRLRSAYNSLKRNKQYLFTWYDNPDAEIPNTNNKLEGTFTDLKNKLRNHNGLSRERKIKFIDGFLKAYSPKVFNKKG